MALLRTLRDGMRRLRRRDAFERDLDDEVAHFVDMEARDLVARGLAPAEALRVARARVGGVERIKEDARAGGWEFVVETAWQDVRYALRALARHPTYTLAALATLAIGIGGTTTVFTIVNAAWLRPAPHLRAPEELVALYTSDYSGPAYGTSSYPDFEAFRADRRIFQGAVAASPTPMGVGTGDDLRNEGVELVSGGYFDVLGVPIVRGRGLREDEAHPGIPVAVAVISHALWMDRFAGRDDAIGATLHLNGHPFTVVGVAAAGYQGMIRGLAMAAWIPVPAAVLVGAPSDPAERGDRGFLVMARLAPGTTVPQATAALATVSRNLLRAYPEQWRDVSGNGRRISVLREAEARVLPAVRGPVLGFSGLLAGTSLLVLLVCCANVAGLTLARATRRRHEMGVRLSLGASRRRVIRQVLTESAVLASCGALLGLLLAWLAVRGIATWQPPLPLRLALDLRLDARVLGVTLAATLLTGVLFGLSPAFRASRASVTGMLKGDAGTITFSRGRTSLQGLLVSLQVAVSLLLLVGAVGFLRSLQAAGRIDLGFTPNHLLLVDVAPRPDLPPPADPWAAAEAMRVQVAGLPGVVSVSWGEAVPLALGASRTGIAVDGYRRADGEDMEFHFNDVGPDYLEVLGATIAAGRGIAATDVPGATPVVVVNEAMARRFWPGRQALGQRISTAGPTGPWHEIVGVVRDARMVSLTAAPQPYLFFAGRQRRTAGRLSGLTLHVRTTGEPMSLRDAVRREVAAIAPAWQVRDIRSMSQQVGTAVMPQRVASVMLSMFGVIAALLASVGLYGVVALAVAGRRREIGIRMALGAQGAGVIRMVTRDGLRLAAVGATVGLAAGWGVTRVLAAFLIGDASGDPFTLLAAVALLGVVTLVAAWLPARAAARIRPMIALRDDLG